MYHGKRPKIKCRSNFLREKKYGFERRHAQWGSTMWLGKYQIGEASPLSRQMLARPGLFVDCDFDAISNDSIPTCLLTLEILPEILWVLTKRFTQGLWTIVRSTEPFDELPVKDKSTSQAVPQPKQGNSLVEENTSYSKEHAPINLKWLHSKSGLPFILRVVLFDFRDSLLTYIFTFDLFETSLYHICHIYLEKKWEWN